MAVPAESDKFVAQRFSSKSATALQPTDLPLLQVLKWPSVTILHLPALPSLAPHVPAA